MKLIIIIITVHNRDIYDYAHEQVSKGAGGLGGREGKKEGISPLVLFFSLPLPLPIFVPAMQAINKVRCNGSIDV